MSALTLTDVAKFSPNVRTEMIDEAAKNCPEFNVLPWKSVPGYTYLTIVRTANPTVSFRDVNEGADSTHSTYINRTITCSVLNPRWECDKAVADAHIDGAEAYIAMEALAQMQGAIVTASTQLWYGTDADAKGFAGLASQVDSGMVVDAGGTTANTGSSVYIVWASQPDYLTWVLGADGNFEIGDVRSESITDANDKRYSAYVQDGTFWVGCQLGHAKSVARIRDLTADSGKGLTDDLIYQAFDKFPVALQPTAIFMNKRSLAQLRASRQATNATGAPAPTPTEVEGVPIYPTEALKNTEALV